MSPNMSSKQQQQPQHQRAPQLPSTLPFSLTSKATGSNVASTRSQSNSTNNSKSNSNNGNVSSGGSNRINASNGTETSTFSYDAFSATVEDQVATGTKAILKSPHISDGPGRIMNAPVPSVFRDDRGSIDRLRVGHQRINLLHSKASVMRSGYVHPNAKYDMVISGTVEVWTLTPSGTNKQIYNALESFTIPPYTPHILHSLSESVLAEWWDPPSSMSSPQDHQDEKKDELNDNDCNRTSISSSSDTTVVTATTGNVDITRTGTGGETKCWYYHPYRNIVDVQNAMLSKSAGQHHHLVPQNDFEKQFHQSLTMPYVKNFIWLSTGILIGFVLCASTTSIVMMNPSINVTSAGSGIGSGFGSSSFGGGSKSTFMSFSSLLR